MNNCNFDSQKNENTDSENCSVCKELLAHIEQFFQMLDTARKHSVSDWLTVDEIASELKLSKTVIYRLIRNGELEAIDVVENNGKISQKGHYRIKRQSLQKFINAKQVKPLPKNSTRPYRPRNWPKVKNHLGL